MSFDKNMSMNHLPQSAIGKKPGDLLNKANIKNDKQNQPLTNLQNQNPQQTKITPGQSLINTNSNISISQPVLTNPAINQTVLNATNVPQKTLNAEIKTSSNSNQVQSTPVQGEFQGAKDLPAYAGIANMSLKSWVAQNSNQRNPDISKTPLAELFEAIKGFDKSNYEEEDDEDPLQKLKDAREGKRKALVLLSKIFGAEEHSGIEQTELAVNISNFKKLGKKFKNQNSLTDEKPFEFKTSPPTPAEAEKPLLASNVKIQHLHELFALPKEFPECLRLFAAENIEINPQYFKSFILQRLKIMEEHAFVKEKSLNKAIQKFVLLLNQNENQLLCSLLLLYYPLPLPVLKDNVDFLKEWKINKNKKEKSEAVIASCEIYYVSILRGRFLIKIELFDNGDLTVDIQTAKENNGIARDIELAIEEGMFLLEKSPNLSELNVLLTGEIYKATDVDEELSIVSTGKLRLEIIIAAYSALSILNKLNIAPDPSGLIEMLD